MTLAKDMKYYFTCPHCKGDEGFTLPAEQSSGLGCLLLFFGGFIPALLFADAQSHRVQCDSCGYIFRQPALPKTGVAKLATAILLVTIAAFVAAVVLICSPDLAEAVPQPKVVQDLVLMMTDHTGAFVVLVGTTAAAMLCICFLAAAATSFAQRRRLSKEFELRPKPRTMATNRQRPAGQVSSEPAPSAPSDEPSA